ncbi:MAG: DUF4333 domain-containing protein [Acidimicrobiales bacterium]|nr:DUF4333 domain-containing protein [Acidimicrobiales bacterium]
MTVAGARRARPATAVVALVVGLASGAAGCSSSPSTLGGEDLAAEVQAAAGEAIGVEVDSVTCDADLRIEAGDVTTCVAGLGDAGEVDLEVEVLDAEGALSVRPQAVVIDRAEVAEDLKALLKSRFERSFQADCGEPGPEVVEPDDTFVCRARDADSRRSVRVTVTDPAGTLAFEVLDET